MPADFTLPPDTRTTGSGNPPLDMDAVVDALTASGAGRNVLNAAFAGGADPTGVADSTAAFLAACATGTTVAVPPGDYTVNTAQLQAVTGLHLIGAGYESTTINCTAGSGTYFMTFDGTGGLVEDVRIEGLTIAATGMDIFYGAYMQRCRIVDCQLIQNSAGNAIFNVSGGNALMQECLFASNAEYVYGATRTIEAWHLDFSQPGGQSCNDNTWDYSGRKIFPGNTSPADTAKYWMKFIGTGTGNAPGSHGNRWRNMIFELRYGTGGLMHFQNVGIADIQNISSEDLAATTVGSALLLFDGISGTDGCASILIRNYSRRGGSGISSSLPDIKLNAYCTQFTIDAPSQASGGTQLTIDLQSATPVRLSGAWPAAYTLLNSGGVAPAAPVQYANLNPTGTASTSQVMMGLGSTAVYTPRGTGKVLVGVTGLVSATTATAIATVGARYGTGTAPANGAAGTGSNIGGGVMGIEVPSTTGGVPFAFNAVLALTAGTAYWFDLVAKASTGTVTPTLVTFTIMETS